MTCTETEEWRVIADFPDYAVSNFGRVKRIVSRGTSRAGKMLKQCPTHGYMYVYLTIAGKVRSRRVNRLVCAAFHGPAPTPEHHAAHNDGVQANNRSENLQWKTPLENNLDKTTHGTMATGDRNGARLKPESLARGQRNGKYTKPERTPRGEGHGQAKLTADMVFAIRSDVRSQRKIAAAYGMSRGAIVSIKSGDTWRHLL